MIVAPEPGIEGYDIIGDVHGCHDALVALLEQMGYACHNGVYEYPGRKVVFLGDILDRGRHIRETYQLVRSMVDAGKAWLILGNHEFNAVTYATRAPAGWERPYVARRTRRLIRQLLQTLKQFRGCIPEWESMIAWLRRQPLLLEFAHFRAVHACWDNAMIERLREINPACTLEDDEFLLNLADWRNEERRIIERLLKGINVPLPEGFTIRGSDGVERDRFRSAFWHESPLTYGDLVFQPDGLPHELHAWPISNEEKSLLTHYDANEKPLFVGHYWRQGEPSLLTPNIACLDYSAVRAGLLVAYRMSTESTLDPAHLVWVKARGEQIPQAIKEQ